MCIYFSGIFDASKYKANNKDIKFFPPLIHWFYFGRFEDRLHGQSPLFKWLIPLLLCNKIPTRQVKKLYRLRNSNYEFNRLATELKLNINDLNFFIHLDHNDFIRAYKLTKKSPQSLSNEVLFDSRYYFADRHNHMDNLPNSLAWSKKQNGLSLERLIKAQHIAQSLSIDLSEYSRRILNKIIRDKKLYNLNNQLFKARFVVFNTGSEVSIELKRLGLLTLKKHVSRQIDDFIDNAFEFSELFNIATYNLLHKNQLVYNIATKCAQPVTDNINCLKKIKLRLLMPNYWIFPLSKNEVTGNVIRLHKQIISELLRDKTTTIYPVIATPLYDISDEINFDYKTLSYHTLVRGKQNQKYIHYKEAYLPGYFCIDELGYSGWSSLSNFKSPYKENNVSTTIDYHKSLQKKFISKNLTKYKQYKNSKFKHQSLPHEFLFAALQVPDDTVTYWAHMPTKIWLKALYEFAKNKKIVLVVKIHPKDKTSNLRKFLKTLNERFIFITDAPIHHIIAKSMAVITTNSGVGFEALMHHKPVITCGRSDYNSATIEVRNINELNVALQKINQKSFLVNKLMVNSFLEDYCNKYCITEENKINLFSKLNEK